MPCTQNGDLLSGQLFGMIISLTLRDFDGGFSASACNLSSLLSLSSLGTIDLVSNAWVDSFLTDLGESKPFDEAARGSGSAEGTAQKEWAPQRFSVTNWLTHEVLLVKFDVLYKPHQASDNNTTLAPVVTTAPFPVELDPNIVLMFDDGLPTPPVASFVIGNSIASYFHTSTTRANRS